MNNLSTWCTSLGVSIEAYYEDYPSQVSARLTSTIEMVLIDPTIYTPEPIVVPEYYIGQDLSIAHSSFTIDPDYYVITSYTLNIDPSLATVTYDSGTSSWKI